MPATSLLSTRGLAASALLLTGAVSCMLTSPLDDLPTAAEPGEGGSGGSVGGNASLGGSPTDGGKSSEAGQAGEEPGPDVECRTNADCVKGSGKVPYLCRASDHTCQVIRTGNCPLSEGDAADPNAIFFGAFANLSTTAPKDNAIVQSHLLALDDFKGGLPLPDGKRPIVLVVCNNSSSAAADGLKHLVEDLEVPAVLATLKPEDLRQGFDTYGARDVFFISPVTLTKDLVGEDDRGLIWNLLGQPADFTAAYIKLLEHTETHLRTKVYGTKEAPMTEPVRVALVTTEDPFDAELAELIAPVLRFNGKFTSANQKDENYHDYVVTPDTNLAELANAIAEKKPHIIVSMAGGVVTSSGGLIQELEDIWDLSSEQAPLPYYLLSPYNSGDLAYIKTRVLENYNTSKELLAQDRFVGIAIAAAADSTLQNEYAVHLNNKFEGAYADTANYYDAFYFLSYAVVAAGTEEPLSGLGIARGMKRLLSGPSFEPVPDQISDVFKALSKPEATIKLESTLGPPGFDALTGSRPVDPSLLCFSRIDADVALEREVRRFDRDANDFVGDGPFCSSNMVP